MKTLNMLICILLLSYAANAQMPGENHNELKTQYGIYGGLNFNYNSPNFRPDPSFNNLDFSKKQENTSGNIGIIGDFPLSRLLMFSGRIGYNGMSGTLSQSMNGNTYDMNTSLSYLELSPALQLHNLIFSQRFYLLGGLEFGIPLAKSYSLTNTNANNTIVNTQSIPNMNMRSDLILGAGYQIPLSNSVNLIPEVTYRVPFNNTSSNSYFESWKIPQLRAGIALTFQPGSEQRMNMGEAAPVPNNFDVSMKEVDGVNNGKTTPLKDLSVQEAQYNELHPFLSYVFFDEGKSVPLSRTQDYETGTTTGKFMLSGLKSNSLDINKHTLDIIGTRMEHYKDAVLTVTGTNDGQKEKAIKGISLERANFVKNYLKNVYNIEDRRIEVDARALPEKPSNPEEADGVVENRRVEFSSTIPDVLDPVEIHESSVRITSPGMVEFIPAINSTLPVTKWELTIYQGSDKITDLTGKSAPQSILWPVQPNTIRKSEIPVEWNFTVNNSEGKTKVVKGTIPVDWQTREWVNGQMLPDKIVNKYSLILFDFDKSEITPENARIIKDKILPVIKGNSTVSIVGYTDRTGTDDHDMKLSSDRADVVKDALQSHVNCTYNAKGVGKTVALYDNETPVGRQLCRTVQIIVETPVSSSLSSK